MIWILSLNGNSAHIYSYNPKKNDLILLKEFTNPSAHLKKIDLLTDKPGHYQTMHSAKGSYETPSDSHEVELDRFTKKIAATLKKDLVTHKYKKLILCASPHIGGMILANFDKQVKHTILTNIKKNFNGKDTVKLTNYLQENWLHISHSNQA